MISVVTSPTCMIPASPVRLQKNTNRRGVARSAFTLTPPPYELDALEPNMSKTTMEFHWGKHHQTYVNNIQAATDGKPENDLSVEELMVKAYKEGNQGLFNNAGQVYNHDFFWKSIKPGGGGAPSGRLAEMIDESFGSYDAFAEKFKAMGAPGALFGSGWLWLVEKDGKLDLVQTFNAENPIVCEQGKPLFTMDAWEHAYYLDFQNARPKYVETFLAALVNWDFATENLEA